MSSTDQKINAGGLWCLSGSDNNSSKGEVVDMNVARRMKRPGANRAGALPRGGVPLDDFEKKYANLLLRIGSNARKIRDSYGISQSEMARALKTNPARINRIEAGRVGVSIPFLLSICMQLECDIVELFLPSDR